MDGENNHKGKTEKRKFIYNLKICSYLDFLKSKGKKLSELES